MPRRFNLIVLLAIMAALALMGVTDPEDQSSVRGLTVYRNINATTRKLATSSNTPWCHWCPDSTNGLAKEDTLGTCRRLVYDSTVGQFKPRMSAVSPYGDYFRQAGTVYFRSASTSVIDTVAVGPGVVLDTHRPTVGGVDSVAIASHAVEPVHLDSTGTYALDQVRTDKIVLKEVGSGAVGIQVPNGTSATSASVMEFGGAGGFDEGRAIYIRDWSGPGLYLTRKSGGPTSPSDAIYLDLSDEAFTSSQLYGMNVDYGGTGKMSGINLRRADSSKASDVWGVRVETTSGATQSSGVNYGVSAVASAVLSGSAKNIAGYFSGATGGGGRGLRVIGDSEFGSGITSDSLLVNQPVSVTKRSTFSDRATFSDEVVASDSVSVVGPLIVSGATTLGNVTFTGTITGSSAHFFTGAMGSSASTQNVTITGVDSDDFLQAEWFGLTTASYFDGIGVSYASANTVTVYTNGTELVSRNFIVKWEKR